jgi:hypothetical protein
MGVADPWESLLDRSIRAFYEGALDEGRLACDRLLAMPDLPPSVQAVTRTNQLYYAPRLADLAPSYRESTIEAATLPEWEPSRATIAADGDTWLLLVQSSRQPGAPSDQGQRAADLAGATHTVLRVDRDFQPLGEPAPVIDQTDPKGDSTAAKKQFTAARLLRAGGRWLAVVAVAAPTPDASVQLGLLRYIPGIPAFRQPRVLTSSPGGFGAADWMPVVSNDALFFVSANGATAVMRCHPITGALALEAFHDAPFLTRDFHGGSPLVEIGDGFLALVHDVVSDDGRETVLHRFARYDPSFRLTDLSHPFLLHGAGSDRAGGLAFQNGVLAIVSTGAGREPRVAVASIDLAEALALLQPVALLAPGGNHAFPMPGDLLAALERQSAPIEPDPNGIALDHLPVLRPETAIAAMRGTNRQSPGAELPTEAVSPG